MYGLGLAIGSTFLGYAPTTATLAYPGINGNHAARFDGANDLLTILSAASIDNLFVGGGYGAAVFTGDVAGSFDYFFSKDARWSIYMNNSHLAFNSSWDGGDGGWTTVDAIPVGSPVLLEFSYDSDSASNNPTLRVNGGGSVSRWSTPSGTVLSDSGVDLSLGNTSNTFSAFNGDIAEIALFSGLPTAAEQSLLRNAFANKYGIILS